jgi:probable rRNA maturation factor
MTKQTQAQTDSPKITAIGSDGKSSKLRAERLEVDFGDGRRLLLSFPQSGWGDLEIEADVAGDDVAVPIINLQPSACNVVNLRVDVHRDLLPVDAADASAPPMLNLAVQKALDGTDRLNAPKKHQVRRWAQAAILRDVEVVVRLVGESEGRELNKNYRGKDYATNVLTFAYDEKERTDDAPVRGDLVLCVPVVVREAGEQGKALDAHFAHLVVHGMLHLQGFDHVEAADAERMEGRERDILRTLGYADPYA